MEFEKLLSLYALPGGLSTSSPFKGEGEAYLTKKILVLVLCEKLEYKWKSSSTRRSEVIQQRIRIKSELPVGK